MRWFWGLVTLCALIVIVDIAHAHITDAIKRRQRARAARKYGMSPGAFKPVSKHWWAQ